MYINKDLLGKDFVNLDYFKSSHPPLREIGRFGAVGKINLVSANCNDGIILAHPSASSPNP